jgi:type III restriction enzyme
MSQFYLRDVANRLSLRPPQAESLDRLMQALDAAPQMLTRQRDVADILTTLRGLPQFAGLEEFERDFPSLCFALATGVGKTRLMGAFVAYLHLAHGVNNFFILAPNLTIYNKLIVDFTPNTAKYVFKGIAAFYQNPPRVITGDNYDQQNITGGELFNTIRINIFNISKINSEVRGGKEPRIKRMKEVLGESYFNHLANLPDLVLLMDESHRYRASAGVRSINDLNPLFGLELTATPFVELSGGKTAAFKNVVMDYPLARAMEDGFVKEPAVVTQANFDAKSHTAEEIEKIKLEDGVRLHENTKVHLLTYARENGKKIVKPFILVIARDTTHAAQLKTLMESTAFYDGRYIGKVIQVDSSQTGAEEEKMIASLLAVESVDEPTEIVVHVNMLKEGWDVTNLYTIIPLRAANARTLIEQSIGRGLRLPYGARTGVDDIDRLSIVAHDRFQNILDDANRADSPIQLKQLILDAPSLHDAKVSVLVESGLNVSLGIGAAPEVPQPSPAITDAIAPTALSATGTAPTTPAAKPLVTPVFTTEAQKAVARQVVAALQAYERQPGIAPSSKDLLKPEVQQAVVAQVLASLPPQQAALPGVEQAATEVLDYAAIAKAATQAVIQQTIDIPRITVVPTGEVTTGYKPFKLDLQGLHLQPGERKIMGKNLRNRETFELMTQAGIKEDRLEDYIVFSLLDFEDVDYFTQNEYLYDLATQFVAHLRGYLTEDEALNVLDKDRRLIARAIHSQMAAHFWESATAYEVRVSAGFSALKPCTYTVEAGQVPQHYQTTVADKSRIKQLLFGGFEKSLYPLQKFQSDTERRFALILERDATKWFKPAKGQFQIYYKLGTEQPEYIPDFVSETEKTIFMVETKARKDLDSVEVRAKAASAAKWCAYASDYSKKIGGKPWVYILLPHDELDESRQLSYFLRFQVQ